MTHIPINDFNFDFLRDLSVPNEDDSEWLDKLEAEKSCTKCSYYDNNGILPCAVNPLSLYKADDCSDYLEEETNG